MLKRRAILIASVLAVLAGSLARAQGADLGPEDAFRRAGVAYEQGHYDVAAELYRGVAQGEIRDARVEYNLGNAEFRLGRLGQAVLHFERARRLDPVDADIQANLALSRSMCADRVSETEAWALAGWVRGLQDRLGPDRQAWLVLGVLWTIAALVAWCTARPGGWRAGHGWILTGLLGLLVVGSVSWYVSLDRLVGRPAAVVIVEVADVLAGPGSNNPVLFTVHEGLLLEVRAERDEWLQVSLPNDLSGWIVGQAVEQVDPQHAPRRLCDNQRPQEKKPWISRSMKIGSYCAAPCASSPKPRSRRTS